MIEISHPRPRRLIHRLWKLPASRLVLLQQTFALLLCARATLAVIPVRFVFAWKQRPVEPAAVYSPAELRHIVRLIAWAVERVSKSSPIRFVCFPQCLAAVALLRRAGIDSRLHYGVARLDGKLQTHTWLEAGGEVLVGLEAAEGFSTLNVY